VADLNDDGIVGRNGFIEWKIDGCGWEQCFLGRSLWRLGRSDYALLADFQALRPGHVTSLPKVPRRGTHLEAGFSRGSRKNDHASQ
jgi:hypothetical protein